jgi:hypothetical protein
MTAITTHRKPDRSLFKRYDDEKHWGLFIPVGRRKFVNKWDCANDLCMPGLYRLHFCITIKVLTLVEMRMREIRVLIGMQYL